MRVLLVKPQARLGPILGLQRFQLLEPLELGYLAAALDGAHQVRVVDLRLARHPGRVFATVLRRFRPQVVGLSGYSHEATVTKELARLTKAALPATRVVVGGHHATVAPEDLATEHVDAVVRGEGCEPFRLVVDRLAAGKPLAGIANVVVPGHHDGRGGEWPRFPDPAALPRPRRDLWDWRAYRSVWLEENPRPWHSILPPVAQVRTSFGCRMKCSFCIVPFLCGGQHLPRPVEAVAEEITGLPARHVYFSDDENFIDEEFAAALADELERRQVRKRYFAWVRSTTVLRSPELLRRWRQIGLDGVFIGFEFTRDEELRQVAKGGTVAMNERALDLLRGMGVAVHAAFMLLPEYDETDFERLRRYLAGLPPVQCSFTVCTPSPGTPDYEAMKPRIWVPNPYDLHDCMHPLTPTRLPLRRFCELYATLVAEGVAKTPLRAARRPIPPLELLRVTVASRAYARAYRTMYRDYPRDLWDVAGS